MRVTPHADIPDDGIRLSGAYREKARAMYAHNTGFSYGVEFALNEADEDLAARLMAGEGEVPDLRFDARWPDTRADYDEGFREGIEYAAERPEFIKGNGLDEGVTISSTDGVTYDECRHRSRWEFIARAESAALTLGLAPANAAGPGTEN